MTGKKSRSTPKVHYRTKVDHRFLSSANLDRIEFPTSDQMDDHCLGQIGEHYLTMQEAKSCI